MVGVWNMGLCPCPQCLIKKTEISALGTVRGNNQSVEGHGGEKAQVN
jgi:hypothetical protein